MNLLKGWVKDIIGYSTSPLYYNKIFFSVSFTDSARYLASLLFASTFIIFIFNLISGMIQMLGSGLSFTPLSVAGLLISVIMSFLSPVIFKIFMVLFLLIPAVFIEWVGKKLSIPHWSFVKAYQVCIHATTPAFVLSIFLKLTAPIISSIQYMGFFSGIEEFIPIGFFCIFLLWVVGGIKPENAVNSSTPPPPSPSI